MGTAQSMASRAVVAALALFGALLFCSPPSTSAQAPSTGPDRSREDLDPDEPDAVVQEIDRLMRRSPDIMSPPTLNREIARWQAVSARYPASRAAAEHLARLEELRADQTGDRAARRASAEHWLRAGNIALAHGAVRYTDKISHALVAIRDLARLDEFFTRCLEVAGRGDPSASYLPLLDYADGLAAVGRPEAREYYQRAYDLHVNEAGLNKYVLYLLDHGDPAAALEIVESLSDNERRINMVILSLWKRALQQVGRDTRPADAALAEMKQRFRGAQGGVFIDPSGR
jgi:hypothetical protein